MLRTTRQLQDTKADPQGRTRDASGPFVERMNPIDPLSSSAAATQAALGPTPTGNNSPLLARTTLSFSYDPIPLADAIVSSGLTNNITTTFLYAGEFAVTDNNNDALTNTISLTLSYS